MESLKNGHTQYAKCIKEFKRELRQANDFYNMPDHVDKKMQDKKQREKNDYKNFESAEQKDIIRRGNFANSVFLMNQKRGESLNKDRGEVKEVSHLKVTGNKFRGYEYLGGVDGI
jgi:hypothetical protein